MIIKCIIFIYQIVRLRGDTVGVDQLKTVPNQTTFHVKELCLKTNKSF